jgi:hypothetical protein
MNPYSFATLEVFCDYVNELFLANKLLTFAAQKTNFYLRYSNAEKTEISRRENKIETNLWNDVRRENKKFSQQTKKNMNYKITSLIIGGLLAAAAPVLNAQDKQTLDLLVSKGIISQAEASAVSKNSVVITPKEKTTKSIKLIGRVQTQYENINVDETLNGNETSLTAKNDFIMRRMFLGMDASLGSGWSAQVIADFGRASDGYLEYAYISKKMDYDFLKGRADFGYRKIVFAVEEYMSASKLLTIERSLATRYFTEGNNGRRLGFGGRHTGAYWQGKIPQIEGLEYGVSVTNSYNNNPVSMPTGADNSLMYAANVSYSKKIDGVSLQAGVNFAYTNGMNVAGTSGVKHSQVMGVNPYLKMSYLGFSLWSDFLYAEVDDGKMGFTERASPMGVNVAAEYKFDIGEFGQLGPAMRWSWIDTDGRGIKMSDGIRNANANSTYNAGQSVYVGVNWYIVGNDLKFQMGYEWAQLNGVKDGAASVAQHSEANAVRAQIQVLF